MEEKLKVRSYNVRARLRWPAWHGESGSETSRGRSIEPSSKAGSGYPRPNGQGAHVVAFA